MDGGFYLEMKTKDNKLLTYWFYGLPEWMNRSTFHIPYFDDTGFISITDSDSEGKWLKKTCSLQMMKDIHSLYNFLSP